MKRKMKVIIESELKKFSNRLDLMLRFEKMKIKIKIELEEELIDKLIKV